MSFEAGGAASLEPVIVSTGIAAEISALSLLPALKKQKTPRRRRNTAFEINKKLSGKLVTRDLENYPQEVISLAASQTHDYQMDTVFNEWDYYKRACKPLQPCFIEFKNQYGYADRALFKEGAASADSTAAPLRF